MATETPDTRATDKMKAMSVLREMIRRNGYELEDMEPSVEIPFIMSFAAPKLWALIGESYITLSPEKMVGAVVSSLGADPNDPGSISAVVEEIKRCLFNVIGKTIFAVFLRMKFSLCLMTLGAFPEDLSSLMELYEIRDLLGYLPLPAYKSEPICYEYPL